MHHASPKKHTKCNWSQAIIHTRKVLLGHRRYSFSQPLHHHAAVVSFADQHHIPALLVQLRCTSKNLRLHFWSLLIKWYENRWTTEQRHRYFAHTRWVTVRINCTDMTSKILVQVTIFLVKDGWLHTILLERHQDLKSKYARCKRVCTGSWTDPQISQQRSKCLSFIRHMIQNITGKRWILDDVRLWSMLACVYACALLYRNCKSNFITVIFFGKASYRIVLKNDFIHVTYCWQRTVLRRWSQTTDPSEAHALSTSGSPMGRIAAVQSKDLRQFQGNGCKFFQA